MRCKPAITAIVVAASFAATAMASAQTPPASGASSEAKSVEAKPGSDATKSNMKTGTTTGSATKARTIKGVAPNPALQDPRDAGTGRGK